MHFPGMNYAQKASSAKQDRFAMLAQAIRAALRGEPVPFDLCEADKEIVAAEVEAIRATKSFAAINERIRQLGEKVTGVAPMVEKAAPKW